MNYSSVLILGYLYCLFVVRALPLATGDGKKPVNVLLMLADDLGYGDTSVFPFMGSNILTPELERMASRGMIMTNFHTAAATCTPTRASILTGMFPWRMGIKAVFEYGTKGKSNRDDWLPLVPTSAMAFRDAGWFTGHSGKWHVGGMRNDDLDMRKLPKLESDVTQSHPGNKRCPHPGPNQQGFEEYVSVLDGPGSPRQNELQVGDTLYSQGCNHLLRNDETIGRAGNDNNPREFLSDCEARHAIRMMTESVANSKPFFVQVWFHAPHGPWEEVPYMRGLYPDPPKPPMNEMPNCNKNGTARYCVVPGPVKRLMDRGLRQMDKYRTMVSAMDRSIGMLLRTLKTLKIEKNTLVVFLSDNGPENDVGTTHHPWNTTAGFRANKRYLYEGGTRVPSIWQWVGTIPKGRNSTALGVSTDLYPTFLDAAGIALPKTARLDGISLLPTLTDISGKNKRKLSKKQLHERMMIWHSDYEGPRSTAALLYDFKVMLNISEHPSELYDLQADPFEQVNLLPQLKNMSIAEILSHKGAATTADTRPKAISQEIVNSNYNLMGSDRGIKTAVSLVTAPLDRQNTITSFSPQDMLSPTTRNNPELHMWIVAKTFELMNNFAKHGNQPHLLYLQANAGRFYNVTVESDNRHMRQDIYKHISMKDAGVLRTRIINNGSCSTPCPCDIPKASMIRSLPFSAVANNQQCLQPRGFINATELLWGTLH